MIKMYSIYSLGQKSKKYFKLSWVCLLTLMITTARNTVIGQVTHAADYSFSTSFQTYDTVAAGTTLATLDADDATQQNVPIGFTFNYCGTNYTQLSVGDNGFVSLSNAAGDGTPGAGADYNTTQAVMGSASLNNGVGFLMIYWFDLYGQVGGPNFAPGACTEDIVARYKTTGTAPNRIFTIEWHNFGLYKWTGYTGCGSIELRLHETSNVIDFCYGSSTWNGNGAVIGIANSETDFQLVTVPGAFPTTITTAFDSAKSTTPAAGTVYSWCPGGFTAHLTDNGPLCAGSTANFTATTGTGATSFSWAGPGGYSSTSTTTANISITDVTTANSGVYTFTATNGACVANDTISLLVNPTPVITGTDSLCKGSTTPLTVTVGGGTWRSTNAAVATVSTSGVVTGLHKGTTTISYTLATGCDAAFNMRIDSMEDISGITGTDSVCKGSLVNLTDAAGAGTWSSGNTAIATVGAGSGIVTGISAGNAGITFTISNACNTKDTFITLKVLPLAAHGSISGSDSVCAGATTLLTNTGATGTAVAWTSGTTSVATVSTSGLVTGIAAGTANITVTVSNSCSASDTFFTMHVDPLPKVGVVTAASSVCLHATTTFTPAGSIGTGTWSSSDPAIATVSAAGVVTGVATGTANITYTATSISGCGSADTVMAITVTPLAAAGTISGATAVCAGSTIPLSNTGASATGTWSSSNNTIATVNSSGVVTGVAAGTVNITYTVPGTCGAAITFSTITVNPMPTVGVVTAAGSVCLDATTTFTPAGSIGTGTWSSSDATIASVSGTGVVTGVNTGTADITFTATSTTGCGSADTVMAITVTPLAAAGTVSGSPSVCVGATTGFSESGASGAGSWLSSNNTIATVDASGNVTGVAAGTVNISFIVSGSCGEAVAYTTLTVDPLANIGTITGPGSVCIYATTNLSDAGSTGTTGAWASSNSAIATIDAASGLISGISGGSVNITYTSNNNCSTTDTVFSFTVNPLPDPGTITPLGTTCAGTVSNLSASVTGGVWSSGNTAIATISSTGEVTGIDTGTVIISYAVSNSCGTTYATYALTVLPLPVVPAFTGGAIVCVGIGTSLYDATAGGTWSSNDTTIATVNSFGYITGVSAGSTIVTYTINTGCGTFYNAENITVNTLPDPGTVTGTAVLCAGANGYLYDGIPGGTWSSSDVLVASVNSSGMVSGLSAGSALIYYTVSGVCGNVSSNLFVTVNPVPVIASITGTGTVCPGTMSSTTLSDATPGGTWISVDPSIAFINATTGVITGMLGGIDSVKYSVTNSFGCTAAVGANETVLSGPEEGEILGATSQCTGSVNYLEVSIPGGIWSTSDSALATVNSTGLVTAIAPGYVNIYYTITNPDGCSAITAYPDSIESMPVPAPITGTLSQCAGSSTYVYDMTSGGTWSSTDSTIAAVNPSSGVVTGVNPGLVAIVFTAFNGAGCSNYVSAIDTVVASPLVDAISGTGVLCPGSSSLYTDATGSGDWFTSNGVASVSATGLVTAIVPGTDTLYYFVTNSAGCSAVATKTIDVDTFATASISPSGASICHGNPVELSVVTSATGLTYQWYRNGVLIAGADDNDYTADSAGIYAVDIASGTCNEMLTGANVATSPDPVITFSGDTLSAGIFASYQWLYNDTTIPGATANKFVETGNGDYQVIVTDAYGCTDTSSIYIVAPLGVNQVNSVDIKINIYPNPATSEINIVAPIPVNVSLTTVDGKLIMHQELTKSIDVSNLADGVYMILVYDVNNTLLQTAKVVKMD